MVERKKFLRVLAGLSVVLFLTGVLPGLGTAALAKKPISEKEFPVTGKEWMEKSGMDWGPKYYPAKPVRRGDCQLCQPLVYRADEPQSLAGKRLGDHWGFL